jgi:hypothetical protein
MRYFSKTYSHLEYENSFCPKLYASRMTPFTVAIVCRNYSRITVTYGSVHGRTVSCLFLDGCSHFIRSKCRTVTTRLSSIATATVLKRITICFIRWSKSVNHPQVYWQMLVYYSKSHYDTTVSYKQCSTDMMTNTIHSILFVLTPIIFSSSITFCGNYFSIDNIQCDQLLLLPMILPCC